MKGFTIIGAHDFTQSQCGSHSCNKSRCVSFFPLQTCANVCGIVAIIIAAIATLSQPFFQYLTTVHHKNGQHISRLYIQQPTKYAKFLRRVIMTWIGSSSIDISLLAPERMSLQRNMNETNNVDSDSDDDENIV